MLAALLNSLLQRCSLGTLHVNRKSKTNEIVSWFRSLGDGRKVLLLANKAPNKTQPATRPRLQYDSDWENFRFEFEFGLPAKPQYPQQERNWP